MGWSLSASHLESDGYLRNNTMDRDTFAGQLTFALPDNWKMGTGLDFSKKEMGNPVYNRWDSPYYNPEDPDADEKEIRGPGISGHLINGPIAWGDKSKTEDENTNLTAFVEKKFNKGHFRIDGRLWSQESLETYVDAGDSSKII